MLDSTRQWFIYKDLKIGSYHVSIGGPRTHHPGILAGIWKLCSNGVQLFVGKWAVTFHWPTRAN